MDAAAFNHELDAHLARSGRVDHDTFERLLQAHQYGTATPMQWLEGKLRLLHKRLSSGQALWLYQPCTGACLDCHPEADFMGWAGQYFPEAKVDQPRGMS